MAEPIDLLSTLKDGHTYSSALLGTYQFDGAFFEGQVLPAIRRHDVTNTIVLADTLAYDGTSNIRHAGERYSLDHVRCPGIFHPKFTILLGHRCGFAMIGSANLTENGWRSNGELVATFSYDATDPDPDVAQVFAQLQVFVENLCTEQMLPSETTKTAIAEAFADAPWIPEPETRSPNTGLSLVHNLEEPILDQILDRTNEGDLHTVELVSPFFSGSDGSVIESLWEAGPDELVVNVQPDTVAGFQSDTLTQGVLADATIRIQSLSLVDDPGRYLHAKAIILTESDGAWAVYGSPNLTTPALLTPATAGNVELAVLRYDTNPSHFEYLLDPSLVTTEEIDSTDVVYRGRSHETTDEIGQFHLSEATIDSEGRLQITFDPVGATSGTIQLGHGDELVGLDYVVSDIGEGEITVSDGGIKQFCQRATHVSLTVETPDGIRESARRWVSLPVLYNSPRPSELESINDSHGRHGLLEMLNRLEDWGSLYVFLENLNFGEMIDGNRGIATVNTLVDSNAAEMDDENDGLQARNTTAMGDLIETKIKSFENSVHERSLRSMQHETWEERLETVSDVYISGSKLTLWWAEREHEAITLIRHIRTSTRSIVELVEELRVTIDTDAATRLETECQLLEHVAIISYLIDAIQVRAGFSNGPNKGVYNVFRKTSRTALETLGDQRGGPIPSPDSIVDCLSEYAGLRTQPANAREVREYCRELCE
ncbi:hypothetical protein [Haloferax sp. DFSO52]|uniref:hypothetical protein n=1 Tax=Haloferax sp. DFSO52 TaxID=3388505 RepID=UPI003A85E5A0